MKKEILSRTAIFFIINVALFVLFEITIDEFPILAIGSLVVILFTFVFFILMLNKKLKPVEALIDNVKFLSEGQILEFDNLPYSTHLQTIQEKLQTFQAKIENRKEGFFTIIESIREIVWIQNKNGIFKAANKSALDFFEIDGLTGQYYWNIIRNRTLHNIVDSVFKSPENKLSEIEIGKNFYLVSASVTDFTGEIIFILHDISEFKKLEIKKKELVLNTSHELRTPLTAMKGFLETMEYSVSNENAEYLQTVLRNTDRMINIVNDLLTLSELDHSDKIEKEKIVTADFVVNIRNIFSAKIKESIKLELVTNDVQYFVAERFSIEQVFINLIDNALKYTDSGKVSITFENEKDTLKITFTDTGIGIPNKHLEEIFERFFVADKSRTKKFGGTGLGLSIVKHIVKLHDGTIDVESEIGKGTSFIITLPNDIE
jgi:two-component system, OmpR family, phosphate regulon sensor histidine kinase PhoR